MAAFDSELARHLDRSKGGVYKHVQTLTDRGYLVKDGTDYHLGLRFWTLGTAVRDRLVPDRVRSVVDDLAASIGHVVTLVIYESGMATVVYRQASAAPEQAFDTGDTLPLHATASGKAILAYLPQSTRSTVIEGDLEAYTDATLITRDRLKDELETVRQQRLASDHGEYDADVECIAAPIVDASGFPRGAVSVTSGSDQLLDGELEEDKSLVVSASKSLENVLTE